MEGLIFFYFIAILKVTVNACVCETVSVFCSSVTCIFTESTVTSVESLPCCLSLNLPPLVWSSPMVLALTTYLHSFHNLTFKLDKILNVTAGSVGDSISAARPDVYVSGDGGYTWWVTLRGPHHYSILDSGGLIVAVEAHRDREISSIK